MLYLWMPEANGVWLWSRGEAWTAAESLEQLIQAVQAEKGQEAVLYFPSRDVQILQQRLSKSQYKQLGADGLKYLLEEYVIHPIDQMKVCSHFQQPDQVSLLGISQHTLSTMQHALALIPVKLVAMLPDFLLLPLPEPDQIVVAQIEGRLLIRTAAYAGNSVDELAVDLDAIAFTSKDAVDDAGTARSRAADRRYLYSGLSDAQFECLSAVSTAEQRQSFDYVFSADKRAKNHAFNVLPKQKNSSDRQLGYWKACAVIFVAVLLAQFSYDLLRWVKLKRNADQTAEIAIAQYQSWFGENSRTSEQSIRNDFEGKRRSSQNADTQALALISRIGPILMQHKIIADRVSYENGQLNMDLLANSSDALQGLVQQLNQQGFKAELGNIQTQGATVVGKVNIK